MTMKAKILVTLAALLCVAAAVVENEIGLPEARLTIRAVDEQNQPLSGVSIMLAFVDKLHPRNPQIVTGETDGNGFFTGQGATEGILGGRITKPGYYDGGAPIPHFYQAKDGHWQPWDQTYTTILRPIGNAVAQYAKTGWFEIPSISQPCGYDLDKGDWVAPYGRGVVADFVFTLQRQYVGLQDFDVKVELAFSQPLDGIQDARMPEIGRYSAFKWQREAPVTGFKPKLTLHFAHKSDVYEETATDAQNYFFRVRTVEQNGRIIAANYGKIKGGLFLAPSHSQTCKVQLTYYLNPTPLDRNMEFDLTQNLFKNLKDEEKPRDP